MDLCLWTRNELFMFDSATNLLSSFPSCSFFSLYFFSPRLLLISSFHIIFLSELLPFYSLNIIHIPPSSPHHIIFSSCAPSSTPCFRGLKLFSIVPMTACRLRFCFCAPPLLSSCAEQTHTHTSCLIHASFILQNRGLRMRDRISQLDWVLYAEFHQILLWHNPVPSAGPN